MSKIPTYWKKLSLKDFIITNKGKKPFKLSTKYFEDSVPYLDIDAIENGNIKQYADKVTTIIATEKNIFIVADGSRSGLVAKGIYGAVGSTILCLTPLVLNTDYVYYYLQSKFDYFNKNTTGSSIPHLNNKLFLNLEIPVPPIEEQILIAKKLKTRIEKYKSVFNNADGEFDRTIKYKQSVLEKAFTGQLTEKWRTKNKYSLATNTNQLLKLNSASNIFENEFFRSQIPTNWLLTDTISICSKITDGDHQTPKRQISGKILLTAKNVRDGYIDYENIEYIHKDDFDKSRKRCNPSPGDVLMVSVGATIGRTSIITETTKFALVRSVLLFKPLISGKYLMYCLQSPILQNFIYENSTGVAQQSLYIGKASQLPIPFPSIEEQSEIVRQIDIFFEIAKIIEEKAEKTKIHIEHLKQSFFQSAFCGKLIENYSAPLSDDWFNILLLQIKELKIKFKEQNLSVKNKKRIENKKFKDLNTTKRTIVEFLQNTKKGFAPVEEVWKNSIHFDKLNIEGFYEELEKLSKKNPTNKIVKWEFSDTEKMIVILKLK